MIPTFDYLHSLYFQPTSHREFLWDLQLESFLPKAEKDDPRRVMVNTVPSFQFEIMNSKETPMFRLNIILSIFFLAETT